jgi:hypothetical protein
MIKQVKRAGLVLVVAALSGCGMGMGSGGGALSGTFEAPVGLQKAYQSALAQAKQCLQADDSFRAEGNLNAAMGSGSVRVVSRAFSSDEAARVELKAVTDARTSVRVSMSGKLVWNTDAMRAMHDAVYFGEVSCRAYMPNPSDAWFRGPKQ